MRVVLDENPCDVQADTVGEAVAAAAALAEQNGRMVVEVFVDGQLWTVERLDSDEQANYAAQEVRLVSANPAHLVAQTFGDAAAALSEASAIQTRAAELLQSDQLTEAMHDFERAITIWMSVQQALELGSQLLDIDLSQLQTREGQPVSGLIDSLNQQLRQMRDALELQDTLALADALLYDFPPVVDQWQCLLQSLQQEVQATVQALEPEQPEPSE